MKKNFEQIVCTSSLIGKSVLNNNTERLGKIEDIVFDRLSGQVRYVILSFEYSMGMGKQLYALPWKILDYFPVEDAFAVNLDREKLQSVLIFDKGTQFCN
ncbi:MAG: PRC-barrel domain-containing protein [Neisseriaceae bacterium]